MPAHQAHAARLAVIALTLCAAASRAHATPYISEVFLRSSSGGPAVEVAGLAGVSTFTLVTVNARASGAIISKAYEYDNPTNLRTLVVAANAWPDGLWMDPTTAATRVDTTHSLSFNVPAMGLNPSPSGETFRFYNRLRKGEAIGRGLGLELRGRLGWRS